MCLIIVACHNSINQLCTIKLHLEEKKGYSGIQKHMIGSKDCMQQSVFKSSCSIIAIC